MHGGGSEGDGGKTKTGNSARSRRRKKRQSGPCVMRDLRYTVVKEHHRYRWLRQQRLLEFTLTHIHNCKPPEEVDAPPHVTKRFPLTSITKIGIKGENAFYFHVAGDHTYHYYAPKAIEIALEIQRYVASANAVALLLDAKDTQRRILMEELIMGSISLPGARQGAKDSPYPWSNRRLVKLRWEINKALKNGTVAGSDELHDLFLLWKAKGEGDAVDLTELRRALDIIKEKCVSDLLQRCVKPPRASFCSDLAVCVEDVLQRHVIQPNFEKVMSALREDATLLKKEVLFNQQRELLRGKSADVFGLPRDLRSINYKLVRRHFDALTNFKSPNDLIDQVVNIAACIYLTVYVAARFPKKNAASLATRSRLRHVSRSDAVDGHAPPSQRSNTPTEAKVALSLALCEPRSATMKHGEGEDNEDSEVYGSLDACLNPKEASAESLRGKTCFPSTTAEFTGEDSLDDKFSEAASQLRRPSQGEYREMVLSISPEASVDNTEEELNLSQLQLDSVLVARLHHGGISTDEMLPLFTHLLCEVDAPELCIIEHFIDLLRDPDDTSERAYYFTTLAAAIRMVCERQA
ncbi:uncharacterized protein Tco025E_03837 [Trypanosoma conorhini]|uniref:VPS9 domain-containing protein n=1 Tax=Trypanosoma conorhini TaxID=83891 RepID=A0A422PSR3_9TRYP|nr:uncharacterized protein Tco025E_03837 [Trypanosoma conorhini]RNF20766.1 hypothetical protein Tco025E_03837 [Trypanosoma conorhini]